MTSRGLFTAIIIGLFAVVVLVAPRAGQADDEEKLDRKAQLKLMKTYTKALSVKCTHCHVAKKFKIETPKKKVSLHCRNEFERKLVTDKGKSIRCSTCHDGDTDFLPDDDVGDYCKENFVGPLRLKEGKKKISCTTCHGDETKKPGKFLPPRE